MTLSIIIVNYNVKYFLEQAIGAVERACKGIDAEIFVVDNNSSDGSIEMVMSKFPSIKLIANKDNPGFSIANNQAIVQSNGKYVLLLNPDTVVAEDTFTKCIEFMDAHDDAGAIGVRMVDGRGIFLPESKRSLPTPLIAFYKMIGLSSIFPRHKEFSKYHLGNIPESQTAKADILSGAYMFMRREALDKSGLLDEDFFMYGEDIDLSYRIKLAGYNNYYFADTTIIHYKGESTKKGSLNYVKAFYQAMIIFVEKHYTGSSAFLFNFILRSTIVLKAVFAVFTNFLGRWNHLFVDTILSFGAIELIKQFWAVSVKNEPTYYPFVFTWYIVPAYIWIWVTGVYFNGGYDHPKRSSSVIRGIFISTLFIATTYAFLPNNWRYSRAIILFGAISTFFIMMLTRMAINFIHYKKLRINPPKNHKMAIVGSAEEADRALVLIEKAGIDINYCGRINPTSDFTGGIGNLNNLKNIANWFQFNELIFCSKNLELKTIISTISDKSLHLQYKILPEQCDSIIGSNSKDTAGDLYAMDLNYKISTIQNNRNKRVFDLIGSAMVLLLSPLILIFSKYKKEFLFNIWNVVVGDKTWIGYFESSNTKGLPRIKKAVFPLAKNNIDLIEEGTKNLLNDQYARNYSIEDDWKLMLDFLF